MRYRKVVVLGFDGLDPGLAETLMAGGELPNLARLREDGGYSRLATTLPAQTPVAWSTFAVGANPGVHGIFDFLSRDPATYLPQVGLYRHEQKSRFLPPRAVNLRGGTPVWERLSKAGVSSTILRHPCTYPPAPFKGRLLAGVGVPDLRGGFGSSAFFTTEPGLRAGEGERVVVVELDAEGRATTHLLGPGLPQGDDLRSSLELEVDPGGQSVIISCPDGGFSHPVRVGEWTPWVHVRFKHGLLQSVRGLVRFFLGGTDPLQLFASPVQFDPQVPLFPISHPWDYGAELERVLGPFATLGMAEEHNGVTNGRIDEGAFLAQCFDIMHERLAMMRLELGRMERGLFYCLFDTPDRIQHIFWRFREPDHPAHRGEPLPQEWTRVIEDYYRLCDEVVGEALEYVDDATLLMVASDHGFASFRREVHLNAWLLENGYLSLRYGVEPGEGAGDLLREVDWGRTRAYALGLAGVYLNLRGREAEGVVPVEAAGSLRAEIAERLGGMEDPLRGKAAVRYALPREKAYSGARLDDAPDILLAYAPGYRTSSAAAMGGVGAGVFSDNLRRWSGDHIVDPSAVPGILFMNAPFLGDQARLLDLAPTILDALGVPGDGALEGGSLLP